MAHSFYGRSGNVIFRFDTQRARNAWVEEAVRGELREALASTDVPFRLKTGREVRGLVLREGPLAR